MFKQFVCVYACGLFVAGLATLPGSAEAQGTAEPPRESVEAASIHQFVSDILAGHPALASAQAALEAAEAQERSAGRPLYNPDLAFDAEDAVDKTYEVGIFQTVDWAGKSKAAYAASGARRLATGVEYQITRNDVAAQILEFLSGYWSAVEFSRLASSSAELMHDFSQQAKIRYEVGDIMQVEYETAVLAYAEVRMRQAEAAAELAEVIRELTTLGAQKNIQAWPRMPATLPMLTVQADDAEQLIAELPEVTAANAIVATASAEIDLAEAMKKPDPTFGFRIGEEDDERLIGFTFSIPLYIRNTFNEDLLASMALHSQAEADAIAIRQTTRARLLVAMERYSAMRAGWTIWEEIGASSIERRAEALQKLWDAREINMSEFLLQVRQSLETRSTALELQKTLWNAWIEYLRASNQLDRWPRNIAGTSNAPAERITMRTN